MDYETVLDTSLGAIETHDWDLWRTTVNPDAQFAIHPGDEMGPDGILERRRGLQSRA